MCRLFESLKVENRELFNIEYHNRRLNDSRKSIFGSSDVIDLKVAVAIPERITKAVYKCRVIYKESILSVDFMRYEPKSVNSLKLVYDDEIEYSHKYSDRSTINKHTTNLADDILIVKNGFITDTSFSNIVFKSDGKYYTPSTPLLKGTKRTQLLESGIITEEEIKVNDLKKFDSFHIINAMVGLEDGTGVPIGNILY